MKISFLGPAGTFTHAAARRLFGPDVSYVEAATIDGVFEAVRGGDVDRGVVPIENSTEGSVTNTVDSLIEGDLVIHDEIVLDVEHCLMAMNEVAIETVERIYSHPQALAQCRGWLSGHAPKAERIAMASTAAAARQAADQPTAAAIASPLCAELYGLVVLEQRVQDTHDNATRFIVLSRADSPRTGRDKTTLAFAVHDGRGALLRVLQVFEEHEINLTRIESRPSRQRAWDYVFLADLEGHRADSNVNAALAVLSQRCPMVRVLGSYSKSLSRA